MARGHHRNTFEGTMSMMLAFVTPLYFAEINYNWVKIRQCIRDSTHCDAKEQGFSQITEFALPLSWPAHIFTLRHLSQENQNPLFKKWWPVAAQMLGELSSYNNLGCVCCST